ncbi:MAG: peptidase S8 [Bacteroidetes bacterium 4572_77]|nr:MAG: peptidase S8 [Bacteroidetes bacterium 4572_77]
MRKYTLIILLLMGFGFAQAQIAPNYYAIQFTDKDNNPFTLDQPQDFLTQRSIDRRTAQNIAYDITDLPITPSYIQQVADIGVEIQNRVKWLNCLVIKTSDQNLLDEINALDFVADITKMTDGRNHPNVTKKTFFEVEEQIVQKERETISQHKSTSSFNYGQALDQIEFINGVSLHDAGFAGQGMVIAVLDAGFYGVPERKVFDSLYANNQILGAVDFASENNNPFEGSTHGTAVLSTMGANWPGQMVGTAPKASYWLIRTEFADYEYIIEEYNWVTGAAFADSVGADIINSSLGYSEFDDPSMDHTWDDLDGNTAVVTIGADLAAKKGILPVNSAGNSGSSAWYYISCPADGDSVLAIGATDYYGNLAGFSSRGRPLDPRVKPNVCAVGEGTVVADAYYDGISTSSGTSFSSPTIAGMTACLWQANPSFNNKQIMEAIEMSASQASNPDNDFGYGIPDYDLANSIVKVDNLAHSAHDISIYPNPVSELLYVEKLSPNTHLSIFDISGRMIYENHNSTKAINVQDWPSGVYLIQAKTAEKTINQKFLKK